MATVTISKNEYARLKKLDKKVSAFLAYMEHLLDVRGARNEVKEGKVVSQEKLFEKLGF